MSAFAWRKCKDCGARTHMNFMCSNCGGDPWEINDRRRGDLGKLKVHKDSLLLQLEIIDRDIIELEELLKQ